MCFRMIFLAAQRFTIGLALILNIIGPIPRCLGDDFELPQPGVMVHLSPPLDPPILKGIKVHTDNPFHFDFILDKGDFSSSGQLKEESNKLIKYFLSSLTIPEKDLWVNLSPYEKNRIIPQNFGLTEMGRDLLAEDYMLKQITASLMYPEGETGKKFWKRIYEEAFKKFGTTNIPVNTFNKVWIVPDKAVIYENAKGGTAYIVESNLKVMLEEDYLSLTKHRDVGGLSSGFPKSYSKVIDPRVRLTWGKKRGSPLFSSFRHPNINELGSEVIREIIIPELTKEINQDRNFIQLRQVYNSLILATWYKMKIRESILAQVYENKNKVSGLSSASAADPEYIYQRYLQAFKKGVYNYIKEEADPISQEIIPRKYFSGGFSLNGVSAAMTSVPNINLAQAAIHDLARVEADLIVDQSMRPISDENAPPSGEIVKDQRKSLRLSQRSLAEIIAGLHPVEGEDIVKKRETIRVQINLWEKNEGFPNYELAEDLSGQLGLKHPSLWIKVIKEKATKQDRLDENFQNILWLARNLKGLTNKELGEKVGVSEDLISLYEGKKSKRVPNLEIFLKLEEALDINDDNPLGLTQKVFRSAYAAVRYSGKSKATQGTDVNEVLEEELSKRQVIPQDTLEHNIPTDQPLAAGTQLNENPPAKMVEAQEQTASTSLIRVRSTAGLSYEKAKEWFEANRIKHQAIPSGFWNNEVTAKNMIYVTLDTIAGFKEARKEYEMAEARKDQEGMNKSIKTMADLYRSKVIKYPGGAIRFFHEVGKLSALMNYPRDFLDKKDSPAALLRFALPHLVDQSNPNALRFLEIEHGLWKDPEFVKQAVLAALDSIPGFLIERSKADPDIKKLRDLYRAAAKRYGGQSNFFRKNGLKTVLDNEQPYLAKQHSPIALLRFAFPQLVDKNDPDALDLLTSENGYWDQIDNARDGIIRALDKIEGFKPAFEEFQAAEARGDNHGADLAFDRLMALFQETAVGYKPKNRNYPKGARGFFIEVGGLGSLMSHKRDFLADGPDMVASMMRIVLLGPVPQVKGKISIPTEQRLRVALNAAIRKKGELLASSAKRLQTVGIELRAGIADERKSLPGYEDLITALKAGIRKKQASFAALSDRLQTSGIILEEERMRDQIEKDRRSLALLSKRLRASGAALRQRISRTNKSIVRREDVLTTAIKTKIGKDRKSLASATKRVELSGGKVEGQIKRGKKIVAKKGDDLLRVMEDKIAKDRKSLEALSERLESFRSKLVKKAPRQAALMRAQLEKDRKSLERLSKRLEASGDKLGGQIKRGKKIVAKKGDDLLRVMEAKIAKDRKSLKALSERLESFRSKLVKKAPRQAALMRPQLEKDRKSLERLSKRLEASGDKLGGQIRRGGKFVTEKGNTLVTVMSDRITNDRQSLLSLSERLQVAKINLDERKKNEKVNREAVKSILDYFFHNNQSSFLALYLFFSNNNESVGEDEIKVVLKKFISGRILNVNEDGSIELNHWVKDKKMELLGLLESLREEMYENDWQEFIDGCKRISDLEEGDIAQKDNLGSQGAVLNSFRNQRNPQSLYNIFMVIAENSREARMGTALLLSKLYQRGLPMGTSISQELTILRELGVIDSNFSIGGLCVASYYDDKIDKVKQILLDSPVRITRGSEDFLKIQKDIDDIDNAMQVNSPNKAMAVDKKTKQSKRKADRGGIDFTLDKILTVPSDGLAIHFHLDPAMLQRLQDAAGFVPLIIDIMPMDNLKEFLGIT